MSTVPVLSSAPSVSPPLTPAPPEPRGVQWNRLVAGALLAAVGAGWFADVLGASVPWRLAPAIGLLVVGAALLASLVTGHARGGLVPLGVGLIVAGVAVGVDVDRFVGPAGDVTLRPAAADWPVSRTVSAGQVVVRLDEGSLPAAGRLDVTVGAGRVEIFLPADRPIRVDTEVVMGTVVVDGDAVQQGIDLEWTAGADAAPLVVTIDVGAGEVEVRHERP